MGIEFELAIFVFESVLELSYKSMALLAFAVVGP